MTAGENKVSEIGAIVFVYKHSLLLFVVLLFRFRLCLCVSPLPHIPLFSGFRFRFRPLTIVHCPFLSPVKKKLSPSHLSASYVRDRQTEWSLSISASPLLITCGGGDGDGGGGRVVVAVHCYCYTHAVGQKGKERTLLSLVGFSPSRRTARVIPVRKLSLGKKKKILNNF